MVKVGILGSCILGEVMRSPNDRYEVVSDLICISPFSLIEKPFDDNKLLDYKTDERGSESYLCDINRNALQKIKDAGAEYLLIDLLDARLLLRNLKFANGKTLICSNSNSSITNSIKQKICEDYKTRCIQDELINPKRYSREELKTKVQQVLQLLLKYFSKEKIIILNTRCCINYFNRKGEVKYNSDFGRLVPINNLLDDIYSCIKNKGFHEIKLPNVLLGDENYLRPFAFNYNKAYYVYIKSCIDAITSNCSVSHKKEIDRYCKNYENITNSHLRSSIVAAMADIINFRIDGRKLVLIGESKELSQLLQSKYNIKVDEVIPYYENMDMNEFIVSIQKLKGKREEIYLAVPNVYCGDNALQELRKFYYSTIAYICVPTHEFINMNNFCGKFKDIYNNYIECYSPINIQLCGSGSKITVYEQSNLSKAKIDCFNQTNVEIGQKCSVSISLGIIAWDGGNVKIGESSTFVSTNIWAHLDSRIIIGKHCMHAVENQYLGGSGHAIFDVKTGQNISTDLNYISLNKRTIKVGEHVWIGSRTTIMAGVEIGDGSIIGAGAVVTKKIPNNCSAAGIPAKIIKKDVAWTRAVDAYDLNQRIARLDKKYVRSTLED